MRQERGKDKRRPGRLSTVKRWAAAAATAFAAFAVSPEHIYKSNAPIPSAFTF